MPGKLTGREHKSARGTIIGRFSAGFVEGINDELAVDNDWIIILSAVKHDSAAETALGFDARLVPDGVDPSAHHSDRNARRGLFIFCPGDTLV
jgi:hypothetical protein